MADRQQDPTTRNETLKPGQPVEVRRRFDQLWARGFEVAEARDDGYVVKRVSDGSVLPATFSFDDIRASRKKKGLWWY